MRRVRTTKPCIRCESPIAWTYHKVDGKRAWLATEPASMTAEEIAGDPVLFDAARHREHACPESAPSALDIIEREVASIQAKAAYVADLVRLARAKGEK